MLCMCFLRYDRCYVRVAQSPVYSCLPTQLFLRPSAATTVVVHTATRKQSGDAQSLAMPSIAFHLQVIMHAMHRALVSADRVPWGKTNRSFVVHFAHLYLFALAKTSQKQCQQQLILVLLPQYSKYWPCSGNAMERDIVTSVPFSTTG